MKSGRERKIRHPIHLTLTLTLTFTHLVPDLTRSCLTTDPWSNVSLWLWTLGLTSPSLPPPPPPQVTPQSLFSAFSPRQKRDPPKNRRVTSTLSPTTPDPSFPLESRFFLFLRGHPIATRISAEIPTQIRSAHNPHRSQFVSPGQAFPLSAANKPQPPPTTCFRYATLCLSPKRPASFHHQPSIHRARAACQKNSRRRLLTIWDKSSLSLSAIPLWLPTSNKCMPGTEAPKVKQSK